MFKNLQLSAFKEKSFEDKEGKKYRNSLSLMFYKIFVLKMSQDSQDNTCAGVCFVGDLQLHYKRDSGTGVFLLTFAEFFEKRRA